MTDHPIIFSGPMVRALLEGRKTQTRRILRVQPEDYTGDVHPSKVGKSTLHPAPYLDAYCGGRKAAANPRGMTENWCWWTRDDRCGPSIGKCPFGQPGNQLWVREAWRTSASMDKLSPIAIGAACLDAGYRRPWAPIEYAAGGAVDLDAAPGEQLGKRRPSIHMPRWASRLTLKVTDIRAQRLHDMTLTDLEAEGIVDRPEGMEVGEAHSAWVTLWNSLHGIAAWEANPWVWAVSFEVHRGNIDALAAPAVAA